MKGTRSCEMIWSMGAETKEVVELLGKIVCRIFFVE